MVQIVVVLVAVLGVYEVVCVICGAPTGGSNMSALAHPLRAFRRVSKKKRIAVIVVGVCLACAGGAFAYYLASVSGSGQDTENAGGAPSAVLGVTMQYAPGLTPGQSEQGLVQAKNSTSSSVTVNKVTYTVTTPQGSVCDPSWFTVTSNLGGGGMAVGPNNQYVTVDTPTIKFVDSGTDQTACAGTPVTIEADVS